MTSPNTPAARSRRGWGIAGSMVAAFSLVMLASSLPAAAARSARPRYWRHFPTTTSSTTPSTTTPSTTTPTTTPPTTTPPTTTPPTTTPPTTTPPPPPVAAAAPAVGVR